MEQYLLEIEIEGIIFYRPIYVYIFQKILPVSIITYRVMIHLLTQF